MKEKLLKRDDFNIIIVDWSNGAKAPYEQAAGNTRIVGAQMAELIRFLVSSTNATFESFYFVGFDLGAHAAGYAGKKIVKLEGTTLGRITGMNRSLQHLVYGPFGMTYIYISFWKQLSPFKNAKG